MRFLRAAVLLPVLLMLAACGDKNKESFQGWIEANLIFVGPDENGRIEAAACAKGDESPRARRCFRSRPICRRPTNLPRERLENAQAAFHRAEQLIKTNTGTQKAF